MPRVLILGTGSIGFRHANLLQENGVHEPVLMPLREHRYQELIRSGYTCVKSLNEAIEQGIRHAIIATDTGRHKEDILRCIDHGFTDLLVEKPLAINAEQAETIQEACTCNQVNLSIAYYFRYYRLFDLLNQWLGKVGRIHEVLVECHSYLPDWRPDRNYRTVYSARKGEGGVLLDLIHEVDYIGWLMGWPPQVSGIIQNTGILGIESEERATVNWLDDQGALLTISLDYLTRNARRAIRISGSEGALSVNILEHTIRFEGVNMPVEEKVVTHTRDEMILSQDLDFLEANNKVRVKFDLGDALNAHRVIDAAKRSSKSGKFEPTYCV